MGITKQPASGRWTSGRGFCGGQRAEYRVIAWRGLAASLVSVVILVTAGGGVARAETVVPPGPTATGVEQGNELHSIACTSAGDCVAVGDYADASFNAQPWIETESNGTWTAATVSLAGLDPASNPGAAIRAVACPAAGACVAVGSYQDASGNYQGLILTQSGTSWTAAEVPTGGLDASTDPDLVPQAISCSAVASCVAVGYFSNSHGLAGLILTDSGGTWSARAVTTNLPGFSSEPTAVLDALTCPSAGDCVAVGRMEDASTNWQGLIETQHDGTWTASEADLSHLSTASDPSAELTAVSCPGAGDCSVLGRYLDGSAAPGAYRLVALSSSNYDWEPADAVALPADAQVALSGSTPAQYDLAASDISCVSPGNCTAVGSYDRAADGSQQPLALVQSGGNWSQGEAISLPAGAAAQPAGELTSIVCRSAGSCVAAGTYDTSGGVNTALVATDAGGAWTEATSPVADDSSEQESFGISAGHLACAPDGYCAVAGEVAGDHMMALPLSAFVLNAPGMSVAPSATDENTQANVSWSPPADDGGLPVTGYTLTVNNLTNSGLGGQVTTLNAAATNATVSGLIAGDSYSFTVRASNMLGLGIGSTSGQITAHAPPVVAVITAAQIGQSLEALLQQPLRGGIKALRKHGLQVSYAALEPGTVSVKWYVTTIRRHGRRHKRTKTLLASATGTATAAQTVAVTIRLTAAGRRLTRAHHHMRITAVTTFTPVGGAPVTLSRSMTVPWA